MTVVPKDEAEQKAFSAKYERIEFHDMTALASVTFGPRSGIFGFGSKPRL